MIQIQSSLSTIFFLINAIPNLPLHHIFHPHTPWSLLLCPLQQFLHIGFHLLNFPLISAHPTSLSISGSRPESFFQTHSTTPSIWSIHFLGSRFLVSFGVLGTIIIDTEWERRRLILLDSGRFAITRIWWHPWRWFRGNSFSFNAKFKNLYFRSCSSG
jgi:hypothetical protein